MKKILLLYSLLFILSCSFTTPKKCLDTKSIFSYYQYWDGANDYRIRLTHKCDSVFLSYFFIFENGQINGWDNIERYAGSFDYSEVRQVDTLEIEIFSYRKRKVTPKELFNIQIVPIGDTALYLEYDTAKYGIISYFPNRIIFSRIAKDDFNKGPKNRSVIKGRVSE